MRQNRILIPGATYLVSILVNRMEPNLKPRKEKQHLMNVIERSKKKYSFDLLAFNIIDCMAYFVIKPTKGANLSRIMQWIESVHAMNWNRRHGKTGHFFGERFKSRIIQGKEDLVKVLKFINDIPVQERRAKKASDWEGGSLYHFIKGITTLVGPLPDWMKKAMPEYFPPPVAIHGSA